MYTMRSMLLVFFSCILAGCGGDSEPGVDYVPLNGKVMIDGMPLTVGTVTLFPQPGTKGPACSGTINSNGEFGIISPDGKPGAPVGKHKVCVICPFDPATGSSSAGNAPASSSRPCNVPAKYQAAMSTDLSVEVKKPETPLFNIDLKSE